MKKFFLIFTIVAFQSVAAASNYINVKLPNDVNLELPSDWHVFKENQRLRINTVTQSIAGKQLFDASSDLAFVAFLYDNKGKSAAKINVRYYQDEELSQADAHAASASEIRELDKALRLGIEMGFEKSGGEILAWYGTKKIELNGFTAFVTEYKRSPTKDNSDFHVKLVRIFNKSKSFTVTVSYRDNLMKTLKPVCDRIISSLNLI